MAGLIGDGDKCKRGGHVLIGLILRNGIQVRLESVVHQNEERGSEALVDGNQPARCRSIKIR